MHMLRCELFRRIGEISLSSQRAGGLSVPSIRVGVQSSNVRHSRGLVSGVLGLAGQQRVNVGLSCCSTDWLQTEGVGLGGGGDVGGQSAVGGVTGPQGPGVGLGSRGTGGVLGRGGVGGVERDEGLGSL